MPQLTPLPSSCLELDGGLHALERSATALLAQLRAAQGGCFGASLGRVCRRSAQSATGQIADVEEGNELPAVIDVAGQSVYRGQEEHG
jgi:hypothetical protein